MEKNPAKHAYIKLNIYIILFSLITYRSLSLFLIILLTGLIVTIEKRRCISEDRYISITIREWFNLISFYLPLLIIILSLLNSHLKIFYDLLDLFVFLFAWHMVRYINLNVIHLDHKVKERWLSKNSATYSFFKFLSRPIVLFSIMALIVFYYGSFLTDCPCYKNGTIFTDRSGTPITAENYYHGLSWEIIYLTFLAYSFLIWDKFWHQEKAK